MYITKKFSRATQNSLLVYYTCITQFVLLLPFSNPCAKIATCKSSSCKLDKLLSEQNLVSSYFWIQANQGNVVTSGINWGHLTISTIISLRDYFITVPVKHQRYEASQVQKKAFIQSIIFHKHQRKEEESLESQIKWKRIQKSNSEIGFTFEFASVAQFFPKDST